MSVSNTCGCRVCWIIGHIDWIFQDKGANDWPERPPSDYADEDESPWLVNSDDEGCGSYVGTWSGGFTDGWNGRRGGRLDRLWNEWREAGLVGRLDRSPSLSFRRPPPNVRLFYPPCCHWCNVPDDTDGWYTEVEHSIHHDHHGYIINGSSDSKSLGGGLIDRGQTSHRRRVPSSRQHRLRIIRGTELF